MQEEIKACLGGTFNTLHQGHKKLLETAFKFADHVLIGLSTDEFAKQHKKQVVPYGERKRALEEFLKSKNWQAEIVPLSDSAGPAAKDDFDVIVVSEETRRTAEKINHSRTSKGLHSLVILVIPMLKDESGDKISSSLLNNRRESEVA